MLPRFETKNLTLKPPLPLASLRKKSQPPINARRRKITKTTIKIKNRTLAIAAAASEIPVNPKRAAITEMTKKIIAHLSIASSLVLAE